MVSFIISFLFVTIGLYFLATWLKSAYSFVESKVFFWLVIYHLILSLAYYLYVISTASDSFQYFYTVESRIYGSEWFQYYGVSTSFIEFLTFPFPQWFSFGYEATTMVFTGVGAAGFFFFYIFFKERNITEIKIWGYNLMVIILFLPNLHFWSSSIGKGSVTFFGFSLFFYALNKINTRYLAAIIGAFLLYHVRPHILMVTVVAAILGFLFSTRGVNTWLRSALLMISFLLAFFVVDDVLRLTGINEDNVLDELTSLSDRTRGIKSLMRATSGVDITSYSFPLKVFTFWFRPLFFDAPGLLGFVVSFENVFYLFLFLKIFRLDFITFIRQSDHTIKAALITFLGVSFSLAQISGNLGLALRQKSQVMVLMLFVILKFLEFKALKSEEILVAQQKMAEKHKLWRERFLQKKNAWNS